MDIIRKLIEHSLKKRRCEGNVCSHHFRDIVLRRQVGIRTRIAGYRKWQSYIFRENVYIVLLAQKVSNGVFFLIVLNPLSVSKIEKLESKIPEIPQISNICNQRTVSEKSANREIIRKLIKYSSRNVLLKVVFAFTVFKILQFLGRSALGITQRLTGKRKS